MKISTNNIGNYKPILTQQRNNVSSVKSLNNTETETITNEEKKFFTKMYPNDKEQIASYHFYNKEGDKNGVSLGSLFDKRG